MKEWTKKIRAYALKNAVEHNGKAQESSVISSLFHEGLKKEDVRRVIQDVKKIVSEINKLELEEQEKEFSKLEKETSSRPEREGLQELPDISKSMVLRLAPYPSGALHIGNAKTYLLNALYAEKYNARLLLIIDDTIGSEEKQVVKEAYDLIPEAFDWLKVKYEKPILYKSDRLEIYYKYAEELIKKGKSYVCFCSSEKLRENRSKGIECEHRKQGAEETMKEWKKMFKMKEGQAILRIKTNMQDKNPAFRDRVLFRISEREHVRVKKKYKVWPLLEFSWAIDDHLLGITHIIRGKDLMMESEMEKYIWNIFSWKQPELLHAGMIKIEGMEAKISKSKAQKEVKEGKFSGWDDPRTWSIQSLRKRGFQAEAIRKFVEDIGLNQNDISVPIDVLYAINRKLLHEIAEKVECKENKKGKFTVVFEDASEKRFDADIKAKEGEIVHFIGIGYTRFDGKKFYFAHP